MPLVSPEINRDTAEMTKNMTETKSRSSEIICVNTEIDFAAKEMTCDGTEINSAS